MPITFSCPCGKTLRVPDEHAGRRAKCPACGAIVDVPGPDPAFEVEEKPPSSAANPGGRLGVKSPRPTDDDEEGGTYKLSRD